MLIVSVDLLDGTGRMKRLGQLNITNTGDHPNHPKKGNYDIVLFSERSPGRIGREDCMLLDWEREKGAPALVAEALRILDHG